MSSTPISAVYFPYTRPLAVSTLKKSVLLFDELTFLDSVPWVMRQAIMAEKQTERKTHKDNESITLALDYLGKEGFVKTLDPGPQLAQYDLLLTLNVVSDMRDPNYLHTSVGADVSVWNILRERLPPTFLEWFYAGAGTFSEAVSLQALLNTGGDVEAIDDKSTREFARFRWEGMSAADAMDALLRRYSRVIGGNPHVKMEAYEVPSLQASSLRIAEALIHCSATGSIPFTDSGAHKRLLAIKASRAAQVLGDSDAELLLSIPKIKRNDVLVRELEIGLLDTLLPNEELERRSVKELLDYRRSHGEALARMRVSLVQMAELLENEQDSSSGGVEKLIKTKILPEIQQASDDFREEYERTLGYIAAKSAGVVGGTLSACLLAGLDAWQIVGACAVAEAGYLTTKGSDLLVDNWRALRHRRRMPYAYFSELLRT